MQAITQQLCMELDNEINHKKYRYLFVDSLAIVSELDFLHIDNLTLLLGSDAIATLARPDLSHSPEICPKLITIAKPHQNLDEALINFSVVQAAQELNRTKRYICSWIVSDHPAKIITEQFIKIGLAIESRRKSDFIPIFEPFRFQLLHESNQESQFGLSSISNFCDYYYLNLNSTLQVVYQNTSLPTMNDILITKTASFYQQNSREIFQLYASWQRYCQETQQIVMPDTLMNVAQVFYRAHNAGLTDSADHAIFSLMTLRYGNLLTENKLQQAINNAIKKPGTLAAEFKLIDRQIFLDLSYNAKG
ncbi:hypothetical protein RHO14_09760 [Orbus wheelerorum]|uniref:hypothetical protein n=1 Tax=Orbus wheelerorum TaxID=3074111 RepID=UPI00370DC217